MTIKKRGRIYMSPEILLRVYRIIKKHPNRVFVLHDIMIGGPERNRTYLYTLVHLGLVEECEVFYTYGKNHNQRSSTIGYRFVQKEKKK